MTDFLDEKREEITTRLRELQPAGRRVPLLGEPERSGPLDAEVASWGSGRHGLGDGRIRWGWPT
ncbi:MAG: hypothetical protein ACHQC8_03235 [Solirubrobacterales bacterium]